MKLLLIGATGQIGHALARRLVAEGHETTLLVREAGVAAVIQVATLYFAWILGSRGARLVANNWDVENVAVPFNLGVVYLIEPIAAAAIAGYALLALADALADLRAPASGRPRG